MNNIKYTPEEETGYMEQLTSIVGDNKELRGRSAINVLWNHECKDRYKGLLEFINYKTPLLQDGNYNIPTKVYWVIHVITAFPKCEHCGKELKKNIRIQNDGSKGYARFCSNRCGTLHKDVQERTQRTCMERYGVHNPSMAPEIVERIKQANMEHFGVPWSAMSKNNKTKSARTREENSKIPEYRQKINEKRKETCIKRYGVEAYAQTEESKKNISNWHKIHGMEKWQHIRKTFIERYGVDSPSALLAKRKITRSRGENEVFEYCKELCDGFCEVIANDRSILKANSFWSWDCAHELDVWIPDLNLAIEYNGEYWHGAEIAMEQDRIKFEICRNYGIDLVTVWNNDWIHNTIKVKEDLKNLIDYKKECLYE